MPNFILVSYDIADPKRWQKVHRAMKGFGKALQYSVFVCDLSDAQRVRMVSILEDLIHTDQDRVMIVDLGPATGLAVERVEFLGRPEALPEKGPTIV
ncbi:MAG: CRISPR-associated endonuclease Cas2 [Thermoplasmata archaeon]